MIIPCAFPLQAPTDMTDPSSSPSKGPTESDFDFDFVAGMAEMALLESSGLNTQPTACGAAAEPTPSPWAPLGQPPPRLGLQPPSKPSAAPLQGQATGNSPALPDTLAGLGLQSSMFNPGGSGGGLCLPFGLHTPRIPADGKSTPQVGGALSSSLPAFFQNFGDRGVNGGGGGLDETLEPAGIAPAAATSSIDEAHNQHGPSSLQQLALGTANSANATDSPSSLEMESGSGTPPTEPHATSNGTTTGSTLGLPAAELNSQVGYINASVKEVFHLPTNFSAHLPATDQPAQPQPPLPNFGGKPPPLPPPQLNNPGSAAQQDAEPPTTLRVSAPAFAPVAPQGRGPSVSGMYGDAGAHNPLGSAGCGYASGTLPFGASNYGAGYGSGGGGYSGLGSLGGVGGGLTLGGTNGHDNQHAPSMPQTLSSSQVTTPSAAPSAVSIGQRSLSQGSDSVGSANNAYVNNGNTFGAPPPLPGRPAGSTSKLPAKAVYYNDNKEGNQPSRALPGSFNASARDASLGGLGGANGTSFAGGLPPMPPPQHSAGSYGSPPEAPQPGGSPQPRAPDCIDSSGRASVGATNAANTNAANTNAGTDHYASRGPCGCLSGCASPQLPSPQGFDPPQTAGPHPGGMGQQGAGMLAEQATREQIMNVQQIVMKLMNVSSNKHEVRKLLQGLLAQERVAEAHVLLGMLRQVGLPVDVVMYNLLMTAYKKKRLWLSVLQVMQQMQAAGQQPDAVSFNILIDACGKAQELQRAFEYYHEMRRSGLQASVNTYTSLIDACGKCKQLARACELLDLMQREGVHPNAHTFTTIINACTQAQDLERGLQVLHRMLQCSATHDVGHTSITPYTTLIRACGKALDVEKAFAVLQCMLDVGVKPNVVTFNCLIDACGKAQQIDRALQVINTRSRILSSPRPVCRTQAFKLMQNCYATPDTITYTALLEACAKIGDVDRAYEFLVQMRQQHLHPNSATCTLLLEACTRANRVDAAFEVVQLMSTAGMRPSPASFTALVESCTETNRTDRAFDVLGYMKRVGVRPSTATYTALIDACARSRALQRAMSVLQEMLQMGEPPDINCFNMVIHICALAPCIPSLSSSDPLSSALRLRPRTRRLCLPAFRLHDDVATAAELVRIASHPFASPTSLHLPT